MKKSIFTLAMCFAALTASASTLNSTDKDRQDKTAFPWQQAAYLMNREHVDMFRHMGYFESISVEIPAKVQLCKGFFSAKVYNEDSENNPITCEVDANHVLHIKFKNTDSDINNFNQATVTVFVPTDMDINVNSQLMMN